MLAANKKEGIAKNIPGHLETFYHFIFCPAGGADNILLSTQDIFFKLILILGNLVRDIC